MTDNNYALRNDTYAIQPQPPIDYLIVDLITNSSLNVFYGEAGSKKTYSALSMAVAVSHGIDWLGFTTKKAPVLIIDEESGECSDWQPRAIQKNEGVFWSGWAW